MPCRVFEIKEEKRQLRVFSRDISTNQPETKEIMQQKL